VADPGSRFEGADVEGEERGLHGEVSKSGEDLVGCLELWFLVSWVLGGKREDESVSEVTWSTVGVMALMGTSQECLATPWAVAVDGELGT